MLQIVKAPNNILRHAAKPVKKVTPQLLKTIEEMIRICKSFQDPEGVGLAATQVGISEQFFIAKLDLDLKELQNPGQTKSRLTKNSKVNPLATIEFPEEFTAVFNPKIKWFSKRVKMTLEGCLSIPDYYGEVKRPSMIKVSFMDMTGNIIHKTLRGANATIFQHEYDHLHGRLFIDYVLSQKSRLFKITGKDKAGADIFEEVAL